ncbi:hect e3 ubiquitin [Stylonychia lemnae]|uniref:HECT-type E3 ubiquitin transferase n=1 Tax=Stylonychia lemnae TaxID=5949 RepID=A0A078B7N6_STYLE|nr:hect e3 ubiquitin [Stylonychia lemnae]|eukprot:CDW90384.1 hect e3 ubiquitin [Stylonychia lemnae]
MISGQDQEQKMDIDQDASQPESVGLFKKSVDQENFEQDQSSVPLQKKSLEDEQQMKQNEQKEILKITITKLIFQMKVGCKKDICFNKYCLKNPLERANLNFANDRERLTQAFKIVQSSQDPKEDGYAFSSSFIKLRKQDVQMEDLSQNQIVQNKQKELDVITNYDIDYEGVKIMFQKLQMAYENNDEKLISALDQLLQILYYEHNQNQTIDKALMVFRSLLMIMINDKIQWEWSSIFESIIKQMATLIKQYRKDFKLFESFLVVNLSRANFQQLVQLTQSYFTLSISSGTFKSKVIENGVRFLDIFNEANNKRPLKLRLSYKEFYNDAINKELNLQDHFVQWIQEREIARASNVPYDRHAKFTICNYPWILDAANKSDMIKIQNKFSMEQQQHLNIMDMLRQPGLQSLYMYLEVRRENILEDTLNKIVNPGLNFKKPLRVQFVGEPGVDEGGVRKEFFQLLLRSLFDPNFGMFNYNEQQRLYWFNGHSMEPNVNFELIGILMGLGIYNSIILDLPFPMIAYKQLLFQEPIFEDLQEWQPEVASSLEFILNYNDETPLEEALGINFAIEEERFGEKFEFELKPGGSDIMVTVENKEEYVQLYMEYIFKKQCEGQLRSFKKGFYRVCDEDLMQSLFKPEELEQLVCGSKKLDFLALQKAAKYVDGYTNESMQPKWLWEIIHEMSDDEKKRFLAFCTGSDRAPIVGLGGVRLYIGRHGEDSERLPSAHTCFNHLLIPEYPTKDKLKLKLLLAITNSEGFGLM